LKLPINKRYMALLLIPLIIVMIALPVSALSPPAKVELGTTSTFAVLSGLSITNTGTTIITGDAGGNVGLYPGTSFVSTGVSMSGSQYLSDSAGVASQAKTDLTTAYLDSAGRTYSIAVSADLGGATLTPGVYNSASSIAITGTLILDAQGDPEAAFIFQAGSTLTTASYSEIKLINGARYCRVFWQVGSSATLGTYSKFVGHIFALESITAKTGATVQGQLLARDGSVTLDNNKITNGVCEDAATLHVIKQVINDNSGTAVASDFTLHVKTAGILGSDVYGSPAPGSAIGNTYTLAAGDYVVSENNNAGYSVSYSGAAADGSFTLTPGQEKTVTIINNDVAVAVTPMPTPTPVVTPTPTPTPVVTPTPTPTPTPIDTGSDGGYVEPSPTVIPTVTPTPSTTVTPTPSTTVTPTPSTTVTPTPSTTVTPTPSTTVTPTPTPTIIATPVPTTYQPIINITKTPEPKELIYGAGSVTYTYEVINLGLVDLSNVSVTDDKISKVNYVSGDLNSDNILQKGEIWIYTATAVLTETTANTATASGTAYGITATDTAFVRVVVTTQTVTGGELPNTSTPWYNILAVGAALMLLGTAIWRIRKFYEKG